VLEVTAGEIGIVGEFSTPQSACGNRLVKSRLAKSTFQSENEGAIRQLADEALNQAEEITRTLDSVEQMTKSIQEVANSARTAAVETHRSTTSRGWRGGNGSHSTEYLKVAR